MSTYGGVSAFGVVHKSEYAPGKYEAATKLNTSQKRTTRTGAMRGGVRSVTDAQQENRRLSAAYQRHGYSMRTSFLGLDQSRKFKQEFDHANHTPSAMHSKIAYGPSMSPAARAAMDRDINPRQAKRLKHIVAIHHDPTLNLGVTAAALPAHQLTGGRGHVVLGAHYSANGELNNLLAGNKVKSRHIINHELAHAAVKKRPSVEALPAHVQRLKNIGEEARADSVSGAHVYRKIGAIPSGIAGQLIPVSRRYHKVQRTIANAGKPPSGLKARLKPVTNALKNVRNFRI